MNWSLTMIVATGLWSISNALTAPLYPTVPQNREYNRHTVMLMFDDQCVESKEDVQSIVEELLVMYPCLQWKKERIFHSGDHYWAYFNGDSGSNNDEFECLHTSEVDWDENCIYYSGYEFMETRDMVKKVNLGRLSHGSHPLLGTADRNSAATVDAETCIDESVNSDLLWNLDIFDGTYNSYYKHLNTIDDSSSVKVSVIILDEGIEKTHPEFVCSDVEYLDNAEPLMFNHGTHVAGTVGGRTVGVSNCLKIYNYPVCQYEDGCAWSDIQAGYEAALTLMENNLDRRYVINYSVGGPKSPLTTSSYDKWGERILEANGVWVTSAGNSAADACEYSPAYSTAAITVGAYNSALEPSTWFTNYGECVDIWAPGEDVVSAYPGDSYAYASGTSMASPHICGLSALIIANNYDASFDEIKSQLSSNSLDLNNCPSEFGNCKAAYHVCQ